MVANVYKNFYNPNYLLIFFYFMGLFFCRLWRPTVQNCYFGLGFVYAFAILALVLCLLLLFVLAGFGLPLAIIAATNLTPFAGFLLFGAFGVIFG
jgi:hypothetical protein